MSTETYPGTPTWARDHVIVYLKLFTGVFLATLLFSLPALVLVLLLGIPGGVAYYLVALTFITLPATGRLSDPAWIDEKGIQIPDPTKNSIRELLLFITIGYFIVGSGFSALIAFTVAGASGLTFIAGFPTVALLFAAVYPGVDRWLSSHVPTLSIGHAFMRVGQIVARLALTIYNLHAPAFDSLTEKPNLPY